MWGGTHSGLSLRTTRPTARRHSNGHHDVLVDRVEQIAKRFVPGETREDEREKQPLAGVAQFVVVHAPKLWRLGRRTARPRREVRAAA